MSHASEPGARGRGARERGPAARAALALGSNLGDRLETLRSAVRALAQVPGIDVVAVSSVYETEPVGGPPGQDDYLNAVVVVDTDLRALDLLRVAHEVENAHGRERHERWGPRTLDVDVLAVGSLVQADADLTVPHPRAARRGFVLLPWAEVDPDFDIPGVGTVRSAVANLAEADRAGVRRTVGALADGDRDVDTAVDAAPGGAP